MTVLNDTIEPAYTSSNPLPDENDWGGAGATSVADLYSQWCVLRDSNKAIVAEQRASETQAGRLALGEQILANYDKLAELEDAIAADNETGPEAARVRLAIAVASLDDAGEEDDSRWTLVRSALKLLEPV